MSNNFWKIAAGLVAGAAAGYYMNSDKGRQQRSEANAKANEMADKIKNSTQSYYETAKNGLDQIVSTVKERAGQTLATANEEFQDGVEEVKSAARQKAKNA